MKLNIDWSKLLFSWETKLVALAGVVYTAVQGFSEPSFSAAIHDPKLQLAVGGAVLAWFSKSNSAHGTTDVPIPPSQAAQIAAVAANTPIPAPHISIGEQIPGTKNIFSALADDTVLVGNLAVVEGATYIKIAAGYYQKEG